MTIKMAKIKYSETIKSSQGKKKSYIQRLSDDFSAETLQDRKEQHDSYNDENEIPTAENTQQGSHFVSGKNDSILDLFNLL